MRRHYTNKVKALGLNTYIEFIGDVYMHKIKILECSQYLATYLIKNGNEEEVNASILLIRSALYHDNTKLDIDELENFISIIDDQSCLGNASEMLNEKKQQAIKLHWKHTGHHPEHYKNIDDMPLYLKLEMVCDHAARSIQFKTPLIPFVQVRQRDRFQFKQKTFDKLLKYYKILDVYLEDKYDIKSKES